MQYELYAAYQHRQEKLVPYYTRFEVKLAI